MQQFTPLIYILQGTEPQDLHIYMVIQLGWEQRRLFYVSECAMVNLNKTGNRAVDRKISPLYTET